MQCRLPHANYCNFTDPFLFPDKKENPLALLGQYSDDEEEEEAADQPNDETEANPADAGDKVILPFILASLYPFLWVDLQLWFILWALELKLMLVLYYIKQQISWSL